MGIIGRLAIEMQLMPEEGLEGLVYLHGFSILSLV